MDEEFETYEDVIDAYNSGVAVEPGESLTDYIKRNNIKIKEINMSPLGDLKKLAKNFGDALFDPDNKGGIAAIFIGANMMNEANFGDAITKGLAQTSDFLQATGGKASDKQVVELADGRIVLVNKKTGAIEDTGEKGKGTEEPASIKLPKSIKPFLLIFQIYNCLIVS